MLVALLIAIGSTQACGGPRDAAEPTGSDLARAFLERGKYRMTATVSLVGPDLSPPPYRVSAEADDHDAIRVRSEGVQSVAVNGAPQGTSTSEVTAIGGTIYVPCGVTDPTVSWLAMPLDSRETFEYDPRPLLRAVAVGMADEGERPSGSVLTFTIPSTTVLPWAGLDGTLAAEVKLRAHSLQLSLQTLDRELPTSASIVFAADESVRVRPPPTSGTCGESSPGRP